MAIDLTKSTVKRTIQRVPTASFSVTMANASTTLSSVTKYQTALTIPMNHYTAM